MNLNQKYNVWHEIKASEIPILVRRVEPYDLEVQVNALKKLQPGLLMVDPVSKKKKNGFFTALQARVAHLIDLFRF